MAEDPNSQMNANKRPAKSGRMDEQQSAMYPSEVQPHIMPRQEISQVPVVLQWPTAFIPINCTPVTLSPQMMIALSWDPCQPVTIPCLLSNVVLQPCINTIPPVLPAQVLVSSSICLQGPDNAILAPGNSTQINDASNQGPEICNQLPESSNQAPEICTQINDASNQGPDICTQTPAISNQRALSAEVDRQKVLDAAEALLILHNSPQAWEETRSIPGPDGE